MIILRYTVSCRLPCKPSAVFASMCRLSSRLLRKLDLQNKMVVTKSIEFVQRLASITAVGKRHEREPLCTTCIAVLGQENSGDATEALEQISELVLFRKFADLTNC